MIVNGAIHTLVRGTLVSYMSRGADDGHGDHETTTAQDKTSVPVCVASVTSEHSDHTVTQAVTSF